MDQEPTGLTPADPAILEVREAVSLVPGPPALFTRSVEPTQGPLARLLLLHGYGDHSGRYLHLLRWLAARGVACHAFDFRGQGRSEGRRGYVRRWGEHVNDVRAVLSTLGPNDAAPLFVLGHSHGGLVAAAAAVDGAFDGQVAGCVLTAPYFAARTPQTPFWVAAAHVLNCTVPWLRVPTGLSDGMMTTDAAMLADSRADPLLLKSATPRWFLGARAAQRDVMARASRFTLPLLTLVPGDDPVADPAAAAAFVERAGSADKTLRTYPALRHEVLREIGREAIFDEMLGWMRERTGNAAN